MQMGGKGPGVSSWIKSIHFRFAGGFGSGSSQKLRHCDVHAGAGNNAGARWFPLVRHRWHEDDDEISSSREKPKLFAFWTHFRRDVTYVMPRWRDEGRV